MASKSTSVGMQSTARTHWRKPIKFPLTKDGNLPMSGVVRLAMAKVRQIRSEMTEISVPRRLAEQPWISRIRLFRMPIIRVSRKPIAPIAANSGEALDYIQRR